MESTNSTLSTEFYGQYIDHSMLFDKRGMCGKGGMNEFAVCF